MSAFMEELKSRNFNIYAQWCGIITILLCLAIGIANLFSSVLPFGVVAIITGVFFIFVEVPLLLKICPTSQHFDRVVRYFKAPYMRAIIYAVLSIVQWLSLIMHPTSLIVVAIFLDLTGAFYALAGWKTQNERFEGSKILGGQGIGVAQMASVV